MGFFKGFKDHLVAPKAEVHLKLDCPCVALGDDLEGTFTISPREDIPATEVRCEIECTETAKVIREEYDAALKRMVPRQVTENRCLYSAKPTCSPAVELINGMTKEFKFCINIPAGLRSTYMSVDDTVEWNIKGVVAVHGRPDVTTEKLELQIVPQSAKPANQAPKMRLVNCEYCQTAMPETILACPNCGARRSAQ